MEHLSKTELTNLLTVAAKHSERHWLMLLVGYWHGLRVSEICEMRVSQFKDGYLEVKRLKGSNKTNQPLVSKPFPLYDEAAAIRDLLSRVTTAEIWGDALVFYPGDTRKPIARRVELWRAIQKYGAEAGIPQFKLHPHILKHTIAMHTIKSAGIENVRAYLGHKSIASTGAYLKVDDEAASAAITGAV